MSKEYPELAEKIFLSIKKVKAAAAEIRAITERQADLSYEITDALGTLKLMGYPIEPTAEKLLKRMARVDELRRMAEVGSVSIEVEALADKAFTLLP